MQPDKFTMKTQAALQSAQAIAHGRSHQEVDGEHLLLALLQQEESLIPPLLKRVGVNLQQFQNELERELDRRVKVTGSSSQDVFMSNHLKRALDNGVTKEEIAEVITHLAFYSGWPGSMTAARIAKEVFEERGL